MSYLFCMARFGGACVCVGIVIKSTHFAFAQNSAHRVVGPKNMSTTLRLEKRGSCLPAPDFASHSNFGA